MRLGKKLFAGTLAAVLMISGVTGAVPTDEQGERSVQAAGRVVNLKIDGNTADKSSQNAYRGLGTVTCNNSSRLLLDYKEDHPEQYWEIMNWLFHKEQGAGLSHIKIELGCDSDTSSGAEPATKRSESEKANVRRGAGFVFAHDALSINPDITLDLLCWGMPGWVREAYEISEQEGFRARYRWYRDTLDAAYDTWDLEFSYISANQNEKSLETDWTIYLSQALKSENSDRYPYGKIRIVAADESDTMLVADEMLKNKEYCDAVDVIGCHYNSYMNLKIRELNEKWNKEIWYSEGASVATDTIFGDNNTKDGVTTSGTNGMLDIANRIIIGMAQSNMTLYEFQPSVAAYYDGSVYYPKQLIGANHPWSGYYNVTAGLPMAMHFNSFIKKGWQKVASGSYGDGRQKDHSITNTTKNYFTSMDAKSGNYSTVISNDSDTARTYQVNVLNLAAAAAPVQVWETRSPADGEAYDGGWLKHIGTLQPLEDGDGYTYRVTVEAYSMITLTTTTGQLSYEQRKTGTHVGQEDRNTYLQLPYGDSFEYAEEFLTRRGGTPKYTTDLNGAFEVVKQADGGHVLMQQITRDNLPQSWTGTNHVPVTSLGDDCWKDYSVSVDAMIDEQSIRKTDFVGLCARYNRATNYADSGYWLKVYQDGRWKLTSETKKLASGRLKGKWNGKWMTLKIMVIGRNLIASINGKQVASVFLLAAFVNSGRVALAGSYGNHQYDNLQVCPVSGGIPYVQRVDDMSDSVTVSEGVVRSQGESYTNYGRTLAKLKKSGDSITFPFYGTGVTVLGENSSGVVVDILIDGEIQKKNFQLKDTGSRCAFYRGSGLAYGAHTIEIVFVSGKAGLAVDAFEVQENAWQDTGIKSDGIALGQTEVSLGYGQTMALNPVLTTEGATDHITYISSNPRVAVVTSDGILHANGGGKATVTARTEQGFTAECLVEVRELSIQPAGGIRAGVGESIPLTLRCKEAPGEARRAEWKSSNTEVASVNEAGVITAKKEGRAVVTAQTESGLQRSTIVLVKKEPEKIKFSKKKLRLRAGQKKQLKCILPAGSYAYRITYRSRNESVAEVSGDGVLTAKKTGTVVITATAYNGVKAKLKVNIRK